MRLSTRQSVCLSTVSHTVVLTRRTPSHTSCWNWTVLNTARRQLYSVLCRVLWTLETVRQRYNRETDSPALALLSSFTANDQLLSLCHYYLYLQLGVCLSVWGASWQWTLETVRQRYNRETDSPALALLSSFTANDQLSLSLLSYLYSCMGGFSVCLGCWQWTLETVRQRYNRETDSPALASLSSFTANDHYITTPLSYCTLYCTVL